MDAETVRREYWENEKSIRQIARDNGVGKDHVYYVMRKHNIPRRGVSEATELAEETGTDLTPEEIEKEYWENQKSIQQIADDHGCSRGAVAWVMVKNDIPRRSNSEAHKIKEMSREHRRNLGRSLRGISPSEEEKREKFQQYRKISDEEFLNALALREEGKTLMEIIEGLGLDVDKNTLSRYFRYLESGRYKLENGKLKLNLEA